MIKNIVGTFIKWLFILILLLAVYFFHNSVISLALLSIWTLIPLITMFMNILVKKRLQVSIKTISTASKKETFLGSIIIVNNSFLPVMKMFCKIIVKNRLTGHKEVIYIPICAIPNGKSSTNFKIISQHCGYLDVSITDMYLMDWFGFIPIREEYTAKANTSVLPDTFLPNIYLNLYSCEREDAENWSAIKKGNDQSELFALREYLSGDNIKQIHWKMSAKKGQLIIKEASLPIEKSLLIFWDKNIKKCTAEEMDVMAECVASVSQSILEQGTPFVLGWTEGRDTVFENIDTDEQLLQMIPRMLKHGADCQNPKDILIQNNYSKVILIAGTVPDEVPFDCSDVVMIVCDKQLNAVLPNVISFGPDSYLEDLEFIEI